MTSFRAPDADGEEPSSQGECGWARRLSADAQTSVHGWRVGPGRALCDAAQATAERAGTKLAPRDFVCDVARICARRFLLAESSAPGSRLLDFAPTHLDDLCLARACAARPPDEAAWERLLTTFHARLLGMAGALRAADPDAEAHEFLADLWAPRRGGMSVIDTYEGRAPLGAWLALVFRRRLLRLRSHATAAPIPLDGERAAELTADPLARAELLQLLRGELARELDLLPARDRDLLEARVLRAERGNCTATRYGLSASYVSRRYTEVLQTLRRRMRPLWERLGEDLEGLR
jgi:DNA-directed RNA polymerase specialized sigma24 family protein